MRRTLIAAQNSLLRNAGGVLAAAVLIPVAILLKLLLWPFERPLERTADEVADYLRDFLNDTRGDWDFDDFTSIPIADPQLESIRDRACRVQEPMTDEGLETLRSLLAEAEALAAAERPPAS
jgi:hypothetical protein